MTEYSPDVPLDARDRALLADLARVVTQVDPVPRGLAERALFALTLEALHTEMVELVRLDTAEPALRGDSPVEAVQARTITFTAEPCTVMITLSAGPDGVRIDGWIAPATRYSVEVVRPDGQVQVGSDDHGRFVLEAVRPGPAGLVLRRADGVGPAVTTPVLEL